MKTKLYIGIVVVLFLLGVGKLYVKDSSTVAQAHIVESYIKDYCRLYNSYPKYETIEAQYPQLFPKQEWYYWPNETWATATFQYPMTLPLPSALGRAKLSEFFPVIYSYAVHHPCSGLISENVTVPQSDIKNQ